MSVHPLKGSFGFFLMMSVFFAERAQADVKTLKHLTEANNFLDQAIEAGDQDQIKELNSLSDKALCILLVEASHILVRQALALPVQEEDRINTLFKNALALLKLAANHASDKKVKEGVEQEINFTLLRIKRVQAHHVRQGHKVDEQVQLSSGSE